MFKEICNLFWNSRKSKPIDLYSMNDDTCVPSLGLDLYASR